jgi:uncharacterized protein YbjT (DUF2867 family)
MSNSEKLILVTGATGSQGGATAKHLLKKGFKVRAFVRDDTKPAAIDLKNLGAEIIKGDLGDKNSISSALKGVYGVFSVQNFWEHGYDKEVQQGKNVADASKEAGIKHFVYSSVASSDQNTGLLHFDSKWEIEKYIHSLGLPFTIIKPVFFMENFKGWFKPVEKDGNYELALAMHPDTHLQMIAVNDIGIIASKIFENKDEFLNKTIELAGDNPSMTDVTKEFSQSFGKPVEFKEIPLEVLRSNAKEMADMFEWFINVGYKVNIDSVKKIHPDIINFHNWLNS